MRKPEHQWETPCYVAVREPGELGDEWAARPRAEAFVLHPRDGAQKARAWFSLTRQVVERAALVRDRDALVFAARAWLAARGARVTALFDDAGAVVDAEPFEVADLDTQGGPSVGRLVSLCPSNAELVAALGCFDRVVACEDSSDWPPECADLERLGPDLGPNLDRVAELAPDLAVSSLSVPGMERIVTGLRTRGVPQIVLAPKRLADVLAELTRVGARLGVPDAAARARGTMERERDTLANAAAAARAERGGPVRVYLEWWPRPMYTPGRDCYSNELIALAGGVNVFGEREGSSLEVSAADVCAARPEVCFVSWCGVAEDKLDPSNLVQRPGLEELRAARSGHVFPLDERFSGRPGPRMLEAARRMAAAIGSTGVRPA